MGHQRKTNPQVRLKGGLGAGWWTTTFTTFSPHDPVPDLSPPPQNKPKPDEPRFTTHSLGTLCVHWKEVVREIGEGC